MLIKYRVTVETPKGVYIVDLNSMLGPDVAARRAMWTLIHNRYGDVDEVTVIGTVTVCGWFAKCENQATGTTNHPVLGDVPTCDRCATLATG